MGALSGNVPPQQSPSGGTGVPGVTPGGFGMGAPAAPAPTQPPLWQKMLKGGATGAAQGLQTMGQQQNQLQKPRNPFYG